MFGTLPFAYRANSSTEDVVNLALHYVLEHLDFAAKYRRILFMDTCSSIQFQHHPAIGLRGPPLSAAGSEAHLEMDYGLVHAYQNVHIHYDQLSSKTASCPLSFLLCTTQQLFNAKPMAIWRGTADPLLLLEGYD